MKLFIIKYVLHIYLMPGAILGPTMNKNKEILSSQSYHCRREDR